MQISPIPTLSEEINDIRLRTADIVANRIIPNESTIYAGGDKSKKLRKEINEEVKKQGLWAPHLPSEYGGMDNGFLELAYMNEILAWSPLGNRLFGVIAPNSGNQKILVKYGTDEQKKKWLIPLINQEMESGFSMTEPDSAGSDPRSLKTTAVKEGDEWVINGTKMWVTNGTRASLVMLLARTPDDRITCFLVEKEPGENFEGITVSKKIDKLGYRGLETVEMSYVDHRVPSENVLGGEDGIGNGRRYALSALELGRINIAARAVGVAQAAFDSAMKYAQQRETFGRPIFEHQAVQFMLAEMATKLQASRLMTFDAARRADAGERVDMEAGMAKFFASEAAFEIAMSSMRIHGGNGYTTEFPVERYLRDTPLMIIGEGTSEIQKMVIARKLLERYPAE